MEKFGLFDLIDKFNAQANGKRDLKGASANGNTTPPKPDDGKADTEPHSFVPTHYAMNMKMLDFCKRHDELAKKVKP